MAITTIGGQTLARPELTRAIQNIAVQAKKQLEDTGSLEGFSAEYKNESGDGLITLSISAISVSLFNKGVRDANAGADDIALTYTVRTDDITGDGTSGGGAYASTAEEVDAFANRLVGVTEEMSFGTLLEGPPEELMAYEAAQHAAIRASSGTTLEDKAAQVKPVDAKLQAQQGKQDATDRLVSTLTDFLDSLKNDSTRPGGTVGRGKDLLAGLDIRA